jgi:hypothetical protein
MLRVAALAVCRREAQAYFDKLCYTGPYE